VFYDAAPDAVPIRRTIKFTGSGGLAHLVPCDIVA
jgi:hypothetical protein